MTPQEFTQHLQKQIFILDGATGTELQKRGMPQGVCPEKWVMDNPSVIQEVQSAYSEAGSNIVYSCTFGGNSLKLEEFGLQDQTIEINRRLAEISREAVKGNALVAGDIAPTGSFIQPFGPLGFENAVNVYKQQVKGLIEGGVDLFVIETMMDIQEARAALIAVRELSDLPVMVTLTFDETARTLTGTDPASAIVTLQNLGANAVGCNCSTGPEAMCNVISTMRKYAHIPLIAKPNAGLPKLVDGKTVFDMAPEVFGKKCIDLVEAGASILGGCCGTAPAYISELKKNVKELQPMQPAAEITRVVSSARGCVEIGGSNPLRIVGERINPTGKKKLKEELREGSLNEVRRFALEQIDKGAHILDVNVGMSGIDEHQTMIKALELLCPMVNTPLCIDSSKPEVVEAALRLYPGRALLNSISAESEKLAALLPVAAKYGAMFVMLPLDDNGIPETTDARCKLVEDVYTQAQEFGFDKDSMVVDGLVMTVSSDPKAAQTTLDVIEWCAREFKCETICGLSNVSFGLPQRKWANAAFLTMAMSRGLSMAIANPSSELLMNMVTAGNVINEKDPSCRNYVEYFADFEDSATSGKKEVSPKEALFDAVLKGNQDNIVELLKVAINAGENARNLVDECLIPAITKVGEFFEKKKYFLPQLIISAETMKTAFDYLEPILAESNETSEPKGVVIMATVKGDIHDIGKNIVALMLKNYGFKVIDLGKDVAAEVIIEEAQKANADVIGLSALMTTTMIEMKTVVDLAREKGLTAKIIIGGAVVDAHYSEEIGADGYAKDAYEAVKICMPS